MKKRLGLLGIGALILLAGCGGESAREVFTENLTKYLDTADYNQIDFDLTIDEFTMKMGETGNSMEDVYADAFSAMFSGITGTRISGDMLYVEEEEAMQANLIIDAFGEEMPFEFISSGDTFYLSGDSYLEILNWTSTLSGETIDMTEAEEKLANRYIETDPAELDATTGTPGMADLFDNSDELAAERSKLFTDYTATLSEDDFEKDGNVVTHTYTAEELTDYITYIEENGSEELKNETKVGMAAYGEPSFEDLGEIELTISIDTDSDEMEYLATIENEFMAMAFTMNYTPSQSDETITIPSGDQIVSQTELMTLMGSTMDSSIDNQMDYTMNDEEFQEFLNGISTTIEFYTVDELIAVLEESGVSLTDDQKAQIAGLYA